MDDSKDLKDLYYFYKGTKSKLPFWALVLMMVSTLILVLILFWLFIPNAFIIAACVFVPMFGISIFIYYLMYRSFQKDPMRRDKGRLSKRQTDRVRII